MEATAEPFVFAGTPVRHARQIARGKLHILLLSVRLHPQNWAKALIDASWAVALAAPSNQARLFNCAGRAKDKLIRTPTAKWACFPANIPSHCPNLAKLLVHVIPPVMPNLNIKTARELHQSHAGRIDRIQQG